MRICQSEKLLTDCFLREINSINDKNARCSFFRLRQPSGGSDCSWSKGWDLRSESVLALIIFPIWEVLPMFHALIC